MVPRFSNLTTQYKFSWYQNNVNLFSATTKDIIETLIEKFRPDMKMLEVPEYALYEIHESGERRLGQEEKPLLVQVIVKT